MKWQKKTTQKLRLPTNDTFHTHLNGVRNENKLGVIVVTFRTISSSFKVTHLMVQEVRMNLLNKHQYQFLFIRHMPLIAFDRVNQ